MSAEVVVVGAGIAGLAAAWALRDRDVVVLEREEGVGGRMLSLPREPYWLNLAAHLFPGPETPLGRLVEEVGLKTELVPGDTMGVWVDGEIRSLAEEVDVPALRAAVEAYRALPDAA